MLRFVLRRLLLTIPVLFGIVFVVFAVARLLPGDPCVAALQERATPEACAAFNVRYGLDQPIPSQFWIYLSDLARGDLGDSISQGRPVSEILVERLPLTLELTLAALTLATLFGILFGVISAARRNSAVDVATMVGANIGVSTPVFVLGLVLIWIFAVLLRDTPFVLPPGGRLTAGVTVTSLAETWGLTEVQGPLRAVVDFFSNMYVFNSLITGQWAALGDAIRHLILPAVALATIPLSIIARMTRSSLLDVLGQDYIRTARAKGLGETLVVLRHGLRNAILPVVTVVGLSLGGLLAGAVLTESIFGLSGIGKMITEGVSSRDYAVVQGLTLVTALIYVTVNLVVDISYGFLDPRIRLQ
ncbi:MAG TPA: ABC transporter permease [Candidatus Limnocylindria bacterium]|nr:ABC transporter permease [Candidatus Limnocylindria bacterium]